MRYLPIVAALILAFIVGSAIHTGNYFWDFVLAALNGGFVGYAGGTLAGKMWYDR